MANGVTEGADNDKQPIDVSRSDPNLSPAARVAPSHENTSADDRAHDRLLRAVPRCLHRCHVANAGTAQNQRTKGINRLK